MDFLFHRNFKQKYFVFNSCVNEPSIANVSILRNFKGVDVGVTAVAIVLEK